MKAVRSLALVGLFAAGLAGPVQAQPTEADTASVFLVADPGNYVGWSLPAGGVTYVHGVDGIFRDYRNYDRAAWILLTNTTPWIDWQFRFEAPQYSASDNSVRPRDLEARFYWGATGTSSNSPTRPGMDVSGMGRGESLVSGWFNVLEVSYNAAGGIQTLAADFAQYEYNLTLSGPALYGSIRFNSDVPLNTAIPEPGALVLWGSGLALLAGMMRRHRGAQAMP